MHYIFGRSPKPGRWIDTHLGDIPGVRWSGWRKGARLALPPPDPLRFTLKPISPHAADHSPHMPAFLNAACPLFSDSLVQALRECGVDNLDCYPALLAEPTSGEIVATYSAINVIGLVSAADMSKSQAIVQPGGPPSIDVSFDKLVIDATKAGETLFFRLAESAATLIVHESVKDFLVARGFDDLIFYLPEQVAT